MPYTPTVWVNGGAPAISAANLNKIELALADAVNATEGIVTTAGRADIDRTGVADSTAGLNAALTEAAGGVLTIAPGDYKISATLTVPDATTLRGYGARIFDTATHRTLLDCGSGVVIQGLEVEGAGNASLTLAGIGVRCVGTYNGIGVAPTRKRAPVLTDCHIHGCGGYGVYCHYTDGGRMTGYNRIEHIGYAGVMLLSSNGFNASDVRIRDVSPGTATLTYGVAATKASNTDLVGDPVSQDCKFSDCHVEDAPKWEAFDTHGGINIQFLGCTWRNCKVGVALVKADDGAGTNVASARRCRVIGCYGEGTNLGSGIVVSGDIAGGLPAAHNTIVGNTVRNHGEEGNTNDGGFRFFDTLGTTFQGNTALECTPNGYVFHGQNTAFVDSGNTVVDAYSNTVTCRGGAVRSVNNTGASGGNVYERRTPGLGVDVMGRGYEISTATGNSIKISPSYNTAVLKYSIGAGATIGPAIQQSGTASGTASTGSNTLDISVTFPEAFSSAPAVTLSTNRADGSASGGNTAHAVSVTTTGFTARIRTADGGSFAGNYAFSVYWRATGN